MKSLNSHATTHDYHSNYNYNKKKYIKDPRSIIKNTMQDFVDSHVKKKPDPLSAESSSTCSHKTHNSHFISNFIKSSDYDMNPNNNIVAAKYISNISYYCNCNGSSRACYDSSNFDSKEGYGGGGGVNMELEGVVCSMCGDVGIAELLFVCAKCSHRPQHIYCGRSYPNLCGEVSNICNWCLHEEDSLTSSMSAKVTHDTNVHTEAGDANNANTRSSGNIVTRPIIKYSAAHVANYEECTDEVLVKKGHGKAFEYLLLIAAQSQIPQVISESNSEIKEANHTADFRNPKMGSSDSKVNCDLDTKGEMGCADNKEKISNNDQGLMGSKQEMELQRAAGSCARKIEEKVEICVYGGNIPKRQRCNKGINASLKCRKKGLQLCPARPNYRRYKLLADVVC